MEIRELIRIVIENRKLLLRIAIIAGVAAGWFFYTTPSQYEGSVSFSINRVNAQETEDYQYDGYYGIKAAELFGETVVSWLETPSILMTVYNEAGVEPRISSLSSFTGRFRARLYSPQNMVVTFKEKSEDDATKVAESISELVVEKADLANQIATGESLFFVEAEPAVVVESNIHWALAGGVGAVAGLLLGLIFLLVKDYVRDYESWR